MAKPEEPLWTREQEELLGYLADIGDRHAFDTEREWEKTIDEVLARGKITMEQFYQFMYRRAVQKSPEKAAVCVREMLLEVFPRGLSLEYLADYLDLPHQAVIEYLKAAGAVKDEEDGLFRWRRA